MVGHGKACVGGGIGTTNDGGRHTFSQPYVVIASGASFAPTSGAATLGLRDGSGKWDLKINKDK